MISQAGAERWGELELCDLASPGGVRSFQW